MDLLDFRSNLNPEGPPPWLAEAEEAALRSTRSEPDYRRAVDACSRRFDFSPDSFLFSERTNSLLMVLPRALGAEAALALPPTYSGFQRAAAAAGIPLHLHSAREDDGYSLRPGTLRADMSRLSGRGLVFLGRPNNPAGIPLPVDSILEAARALPGHFLCVDESYVELAFGVDPMLTASLRLPDNLLILRSLTKSLAIPRLHLSFLAAHPSIIRKVAAVMETRLPNHLAEETAPRAVSDPGFFEASAARIAEYRERFAMRLARIPGVRLEPGFANFLLLCIEGADAREAAEAARRRGVAFRVYAPDEYLDGSRWLRASVLRDAENERAADALQAALEEVRKARL